MAIALVTSVSAAAATTAGVDTTGADLIVVCVSAYTTTGTLSDSKGNTWTGLTERSSGGVQYTRVFYCFNPTVGSGHTFSVTGASFYSVGALAFSGANAYDTTTGGSGSSTSTPQIGSVTPSENNCVVVAAIGFWRDSVIHSVSSIDGGFTLQESVTKTDSAFGLGLAYLIQTSLAAANPTWTLSASTTYFAGDNAVFTSDGGGGGGSGNPWYYYAQIEAVIG